MKGFPLNSFIHNYCITAKGAEKKSTDKAEIDTTTDLYKKTWECREPGCAKSCETIRSLQKHTMLSHKKRLRLYKCNLVYCNCNLVFLSEAKLDVHKRAKAVEMQKVWTNQHMLEVCQTEDCLFEEIADQRKARRQTI